ncbi:MAG TPA: hypothetical protein VKX17_21635, partial [Planctomycetota bacterium]|nr:hypothetical protein [Planctomycetota bacterium]
MRGIGTHGKVYERKIDFSLRLRHALKDLIVARRPERGFAFGFTRSKNPRRNKQRYRKDFQCVTPVAATNFKPIAAFYVSNPPGSRYSILRGDFFSMALSG